MLAVLLVCMRNFRPINPFIAAYFVEEKHFDTSTIVSRISPWWFYSTFVYSFIVPVVKKQAGLLASVKITSAAALAASLTMLLMRRKSTLQAVLIEILWSFATAMTVIDKKYFTLTAPEEEHEASTRYSSIKRAVAVASSFIAQNMYYLSGSTKASLYLTVAVDALNVLTPLFLPAEQGRVRAFETEMERKKLLFSRGLVAYALSYTGAFTLSTCFHMYMHTLLIDKTGQISHLEGILGSALDFLSLVFYFLSKCIIRVVSAFDKSIGLDSDFDRRKVMHGYIEGLSKLVCVGVSLPAVRCLGDNLVACKVASLVSATIQVSGMLMFQGAQTLFWAYLFYLFALSGVYATLSLAYNRLDALSHGMIVEVMSYITGVSCIVHCIIDVLCRYYKLDARSRFKLYSRIALGLFLASSVLLALS